MKMYLEQNNYTKATVREVEKMQEGNPNPIINGGYPIFNICAHTTLDMSHLKAGEDDNWNHTLSIKVDDDRYVTVCVMKSSKMNQEVCVDVEFYSGKTRVLGMKEGKTDRISDTKLVAVINEIE
jgi:hypothetical protein